MQVARPNIESEMKAKLRLYLFLSSRLRSSLSFVVVVAGFASFGSLVGCAYHAIPVEREIIGGYRTIAVPVFKNSTTETGIEMPFTNAVIRELQRAQIGRITTRDEAQVTLEGTIESVNFVPAEKVEGVPSVNLLPANTVLTTKYQVLLQTTLRLRRNSDQKILWQGTFQGERYYFTPKIGEPGLNSVNALYNQSARYENIQAMAVEIMAEAHDRLTENF